MIKRVLLAALVVIAFAAVTGASYADSLLTSPPTQYDDGLLFVGEDLNDGLKKEAGQDDVLCVVIKRKTDRVWGVQSEQIIKNVPKEAAGSQDNKYPPIMVKLRPGSSASYRYSKKLSSRGKTPAGQQQAAAQVNQINITPIIVREAAKNNISPLLLKAVIQAESNFNPNAVSYAGAQGLCQLMPNTARHLGVTDPFCPEQSIMGGAKYLGQMQKTFGSIDLTLAAYNAGPEAVKRAGGIPNYSQTRRYIIKVKQYMQKW